MGPEWKPFVWENMGWHYDAQRGVARVCPSTSRLVDNYTAYVNTTPQAIAADKDPHKALERALYLAWEQTSTTLRQLRELGVEIQQE